MKRLFLILVVMAFAVSSAVAKGEDTPQKTLTPDFITFLRHYIAQIENQAVTSK